MKPRVNDPCPCGSGRKYKKCCISTESLADLPAVGSLLPSEEKLQALLRTTYALPPVRPELPAPEAPSALRSRGQRRAPLPSLSAPELPLWEPLGEKLPGRLVTREEERQYLLASHVAFQAEIEGCAKSHAAADAQRGLDLLASIPTQEASQLAWFGAAKAYLLQIVGKREEAFLCQLEQMLELQDERLWFAWGPRALQWFESFPQSEHRGRILDALRSTRKAQDFVVPRLLLGFGLWGDEQQREEALACYLEALRWDAWPWSKRRSVRRWTGFQQSEGEWLGALSDGFWRVFQSLAPDDGLLPLAQNMHRFPWEKLHPRFREMGLCSLGNALAQAGLYDDLQRITERFSSLSQSPYRSYWLGFCARHRGQVKAAQKHFLRAAEASQGLPLTDAERMYMIDFWFEQQLPDKAQPLLEQLEHPEHANAQRLFFWYHQLTQEYPQALQVLEGYLQKKPDDFDAQCRRFRLLELLGRHQELEAQLSPWLVHELPKYQHFARLYLGIFCAINGRNAEALEHFEALPHELDAEVFLADHRFQSSYWLAFGDSLEQAGQWERAEACYRRALHIVPQGPTYARLILHYCGREHFEAAEALLDQAVALAPESFAIQYAQIQVALFRQRSEEAQLLLEAIGPEIFEQKGLFREWLRLAVQIALELDPLEALLLSEQHLDAFLADPELAEIRSQLLQDLIARHRQLEARVGKQEKALQQMERTRSLLSRKSEESQKRQRALQEAIRETSSLRRELQSLQYHHVDRALEAFESKHSATLQRLAPIPQQLLRSAERLWHQLQQHPDEDHGPIILQLARVIEGEVNHRLIDPLVSFALQSDVELGAFPPVHVGRLKPTRNRLSLGDAARLLFSQREIEEADGSRTLLTNPSSNPRHRELLHSFWLLPEYQSLPEALRLALQNPFLDAIQQLATLRNRASHAGSTLSRREAEEIRAMVLGEKDSEGILGWLTQIS